MCYTVNNNNSGKQVGEKLKRKVVDKPVKTAVYLSGFSHPSMYIVKQEQTDIIDTANWGLIPRNITNPVRAKEYFKHTLNARSETVFELDSFKNNIMPHRCIIPISGFFEYMDMNDKKYPHYLSLSSGDLFNVAGIYDNWTNNITGEMNTTFSMITLTANPLMAFIHNKVKRQPLLLSNEDAENWLKSDLKESDVVELMKRPLGDDYMEFNSVAKISPKNSNLLSEALLEPVYYPELPKFTLTTTATNG